MEKLKIKKKRTPKKKKRTPKKKSINDRLELMDRAYKNRLGESIKIKGLNDPEIDKYIPSELKKKLVEEVEMAKELLK